MNIPQVFKCPECGGEGQYLIRDCSNTDIPVTCQYCGGSKEVDRSLFYRWHYRRKGLSKDEQIKRLQKCVAELQDENFKLLDALDAIAHMPPHKVIAMDGDLVKCSRCKKIDAIAERTLKEVQV